MQPIQTPELASPLVAYGYARLSREEATANLSASIENQMQYLRDYCASSQIVLLDIFVDDGYSGSNFDRPGFKKLISALETGKANMVITKDDCVIIELNAESPIKCGFCAVSSIF